MLEFEDSTKTIGKYLIFDVETTGLPINKYVSPNDFKYWPYVVQIAWLLFDDEHKLIEHNNFYLKQPVEIPITAINIHGITTAMMLEKGIEPLNVYDNFKKVIDNTEYLICHNIDFDIPIIHCDFSRNGLQWNFPNNKIFCTMKTGAIFCKISPYKNGEYKWPTLAELYQRCFFPNDTVKEIFNLHSANIDAVVTAQCFFKLKNLGFFKTVRTVNSLSSEQIEDKFEDLHGIEYIPSYDYPYVVEIKHLGIGTSRVLKDNEKWRIENKIEAQFKKWDEQWPKIYQKNILLTNKEASLNIAEERTLDAEEKQKQIDDLLIYTLNIDDAVNWDSLKDTKKFKVPNPKKNFKPELSKIVPPTLPIFKELPKEPDKCFELYKPQLSLVDKIFKSLREEKIRQAEIKSEAFYQKEMTAWKKSVDEINSFNSYLKEKHEQKLKENEQKLKEFEEQEQKIKNRFDTLEKDWEKEKETFYNNQKAYNNKIEKLKDSYLQKDAEAVIQYCEIVLNNSKYPDSFPKNFELELNPDNKILILEYELPAVKCFPKIKEVNYVAARKELKESYIPESQTNKMFDEAMYKITLRTIHELFEADVANAIEAISFNGWVKAINRATGKEENNCILSIQVKKIEFMAIDLSNVDPKTCFKNLKGVASSKLSGLTPIQPILQISRIDKRFVEGYAVANQIDNTTNLAEMDWQDFEHLIRELFEKEFKAGGGEVKVTQASRDGGVDAIAFDPDPIRGGKIVIQAKRYTNTVGVSAVRELYGTVVNEGATKGILVSTADYGPDAYEFAKGKPLTLLNGSNLLHLLEKHGHHAKIDLREAKKILTEKDKSKFT